MRVFFLSRDGILDGLGQSQVLAYLRRLSGPDCRIYLMSFEKRDRSGIAGRRARRLARELNEDGISWQWLWFHGFPPALGPLWDLAVALWRGRRVILGRRIQIIHARSYLACLLAILLRRLVPNGPRIIFDMRGFWVDERAEAGGWKSTGWRYRTGKWIERLLLRNSHAIVTLTEAAAREVTAMLAKEAAKPPVVVIPTCVDLFRFRTPSSVALSETKFRERLTFVYVGSVGPWHQPEAMAEFMGTVHRRNPRAFFRFLIRNGFQDLLKLIEKHHLAHVCEIEENVDYSEIPARLSDSSIGLIFYRRTYSRLGCFPTKLGEYLASGLPVVVAGGLGDAGDLVARERVGVCVPELTVRAYEQAYDGLLRLLAEENLPGRCRDVARRYLSLERGITIYREVYAGLVLACPVNPVLP